MSNTAVRRLVWLTIAAASVAAPRRAAAQGTVPRDSTVPRRAMIVPVPDSFPKAVCPRADSTRHRFRGLDTAAITFAEANGYNHWCIPEYHDDQRFSIGSGRLSFLGPLAHSLASPSLGAIEDHTAFDGRWVNVALVDIDDPVSPMPEPYRRLRLAGYRSCVYLTHLHSIAGGVFRGHVVPADPAGVCPASVDTGTASALDVVDEAPVPGAAEYPPVTRFVELAGGLTAVGVRCGNRWCNVGAREVPASAHQSETAITATSRGVVKGWFDDQVVSVPASGAPYRLRRSVRASVTPDPRLGAWTVADYLADWRHVAVAYFPGVPPEKYLAAGYAHGMTQIDLRAQLRDIGGGKMDTVWTARLRSSRGTVVRRVFRTDHSHWLRSIPATARWRWNANDEDLWVACSVGCCRVYND